MNKAVAKIGSVLVTVSVILFAIFFLASKLGSYIVCIFLALGYIMMIAGFHAESDEPGVDCYLIMICSGMV